jgi:hypothetical protein
VSHTKDSDVSIQKALSRNLIPDKQALMQRIHPVVELDFISLGWWSIQCKSFSGTLNIYFGQNILPFMTMEFLNCLDKNI